MVSQAYTSSKSEVHSEELRRAISKAQEYLFSIQDERGFWECELVVDSTVLSDFVFYYHLTGQRHKAQESRAKKHLLDRQLPDGGWPQFPEGPSELNATVKGYLTLKLIGMPLD